MTLKPTGDRKTRLYPAQQNTFGLLPGKEGTCPMCTTGTGGCCNIKAGRKLPVCYVYGLMSCYKGIRGVLEHNTETMKQATQPQMEHILKEEFQRFLTMEQKKNPSGPHYYRLHWAGDIFHVRYAKAIAAAVRAFPELKFWLYTRSFFAVPVLAGISNLTVYLSLDAVNRDKGMDCYSENKEAGNVFFAYLAKEDPKELAAHKYRTCPVDNGSLALEGACHKCGICLKGANVWLKEG